MKAKLLLAVVVLAGCDDRDRISNMRYNWIENRSPLADQCQSDTSLAIRNKTDPCVAYWLRKIAEKKGGE